MNDDWSALDSIAQKAGYTVNSPNTNEIKPLPTAVSKNNNILNQGVVAKMSGGQKIQQAEDPVWNTLDSVAKSNGYEINTVIPQNPITSLRNIAPAATTAPLPTTQNIQPTTPILNQIETGVKGGLTSLGDNITKSFWSAVNLLGDSIEKFGTVGLSKASNEISIWGNNKLKQAGEAISNASQYYGSAVSSKEQDLQTQLGQIGKVAKTASLVTGGLASVATAFGISMVFGPAAGAAFLTAVFSLPEYQNAIASGANKKTALGVTLASGVLNQALNEIGLGYFLKTNIAGASLVNTIINTAKIGIVNLSTAELGNWGQNTIDKLGYDKAREVFDGTADVLISSLVPSLLTAPFFRSHPEVVSEVQNAKVDKLDSMPQSNVEAVKTPIEAQTTPAEAVKPTTQEVTAKPETKPVAAQKDPVQYVIDQTGVSKEDATKVVDQMTQLINDQKEKFIALDKKTNELTPAKPSTEVRQNYLDSKNIVPKNAEDLQKVAQAKSDWDVYTKVHSETVADIKDINQNSVVKIDTLPFSDGKWDYSISIDLGDGRKFNIPFDGRDLASNTDVVREARDKVIEWAKAQPPSDNVERVLDATNRISLKEFAGEGEKVAETAVKTSPKEAYYERINKQVGEKPQTKVSRLGKRLEQIALRKKMAETLGKLPEYETTDWDTQLTSARKHIDDNFESAKKIALGEENPPKGMLPNAMFVAMKEYAEKNGDVALMQQLANSKLISEASYMGQNISILSQLDPESAVYQLKEVSKTREEAFKSKNKGESPVKAVKKVTKEIKKSVDSEVKKSISKKQSWKDFIQEIRCK